MDIKKQNNWSTTLKYDVDNITFNAFYKCISLILRHSLIMKISGNENNFMGT